MQDAEVVQRTIAQEDVDQGNSDFVSHREHANLAARTAKTRAIEARPEVVSKSRLKSNLSVNREQEAQRIAERIDPITRAPLVKVSCHAKSPEGDVMATSARLLGSDSAAAIYKQEATEAFPGNAHSGDVRDRDSDQGSTDVVSDALKAIRARRRS